MHPRNVFPGEEMEDNSGLEDNIVVQWIRSYAIRTCVKSTQVAAYATLYREWLGSSADEGRVKQRYAPGRRKKSMIRWPPNGTSYSSECSVMNGNAGDWNILVPAGKEITEMPSVKAIERGTEQTEFLVEIWGRCGVVDPDTS